MSEQSRADVYREAGLTPEEIAQVDTVLKKQKDAMTHEAFVRLAYELSTWAASIHWDGGRNTREWLEGLRERIEAVQEATPVEFRTGMLMDDRSLDRQLAIAHGTTDGE